jgi:hypothetical protein
MYYLDAAITGVSAKELNTKLPLVAISDLNLIVTIHASGTGMDISSFVKVNIFFPLRILTVPNG